MDPQGWTAGKDKFDCKITMEIVQPTLQFRWARSPNTTTEPDRLQQLWHRQTGYAFSAEWRDVPVEIVPPPPPTKEPA